MQQYEYWLSNDFPLSYIYNLVYLRLRRINKWNTPNIDEILSLLHQTPQDNNKWQLYPLAVQAKMVKYPLE